MRYGIFYSCRPVCNGLFSLFVLSCVVFSYHDELMNSEIDEYILKGECKRSEFCAHLDSLRCLTRQVLLRCMFSPPSTVVSQKAFLVFVGQFSPPPVFPISEIISPPPPPPSPHLYPCLHITEQQPEDATGRGGWPFCTRMTLTTLWWLVTVRRW